MLIETSLEIGFWLDILVGLGLPLLVLVLKMLLGFFCLSEI